MSEENNDAQGKPVEDAQGVESAQPQPDPEENQGSDEVKFSKAQLQQLSSIMGDMVKKGVEKHVAPIMDTIQATTQNPYQSTTDANPAKQKFNERLQEMIFNGQVMEAVEEIERVRTAAHQKLSQANKNKLASEMESYQDKPIYEAIKKDMQGYASELINSGWPPAAAVAMAWEREEKNHYKRQLSGDSDEGTLEMTVGGRSPARKGKITLPPKFEAAFQRDRAKGLFKTREEFVDSMAPIVKAQFGL